MSAGAPVADGPAPGQCSGRPRPDATRGREGGLEWPLRRVVVNLSPGTALKQGPRLDLAVAGDVSDPSASAGSPEGAGHPVHPTITSGSDNVPYPFTVTEMH